MSPVFDPKNRIKLVIIKKKYQKEIAYSYVINKLLITYLNIGILNIFDTSAKVLILARVRFVARAKRGKKWFFLFVFHKVIYKVSVS